MRRFFLFFLLASNSFAQTTAVTGTVKDISGVPYAGASIKAQLVLAGSGVTGQPTVTVTGVQACRSSGFGSSPCQVPFQGTAGPFTLDNTGSFNQALQDNALVTPAGTQWLFSVTIQGSPPPLGTGPQACTATVTITGTSQSVSSSLSACPALAAAGIGGVAAQVVSNTAFPSGTIPTGTTGTIIFFQNPTAFTFTGTGCFSCDGQRLTFFTFQGGTYSLSGTLGSTVFFVPIFGAADKITFSQGGAGAIFEYRSATLFYIGGGGFVPSFNGVAGPIVGAAVSDFYENVSADGSINFNPNPTAPFGSAFITKGSAATLTLTNPTAGIDDGKTLTVVSTTAFAHTITTGTNGINGSLHIATFGAAAANVIVLKAFNGSWWVVGNTGVVLT